MKTDPKKKKNPVIRDYHNYLSQLKWVSLIFI